jgi:hypothetical protein
VTVDVAVAKQVLISAPTLVGCYPNRLPRTPVFPAADYTVSVVPGEYTHDGPSGLAVARATVKVWDKSQVTVNTQARLIETNMDGFSGIMGGTGGVTVDQCRLGMSRPIYDNDSAIGGKILEFLIWFRRGTES